MKYRASSHFPTAFGWCVAEWARRMEHLETTVARSETDSMIEMTAGAVAEQSGH